MKSSFKFEIVLPQNDEYELKALSSMVTIPKALEDGCESLNINSFERAEHRTIWIMLHGMYNKNLSINPDLLIEEVKKNDLLEACGGISTLRSLIFFGTEDYTYYFRQLINLSELRNGVNLCKSMLSRFSQETNNSQDIFQEMYNQTCNLVTNDQINTQDSKEIFEDFRNGMSLDEFEAWRKDRIKSGLPTYTGISTGFKSLDDSLGGLQDGKLYYCGARTSMGKTTFMLNIVNNIFLNTGLISSGIISLEMLSSDLFSRLMCIQANVSFNRYEKNNISYSEELNISDAKKKLIYHKEKIKFESPASLSIEKLCIRGRRLKEFYDVNILFIDYLTRISSDKKFSSKHLEIDYISKSLQNLARELEIPIFVLAQLNRESAKKDDPRPCLTDFRESGSIEEDADACLLLHRPDYYNPETDKGIIQVRLAKNRLMGTLGTILLKCNSAVSEKYEQVKLEVKPEYRSYNDD